MASRVHAFFGMLDNTTFTNHQSTKQDRKRTIEADRAYTLQANLKLRQLKVSTLYVSRVFGSKNQRNLQVRRVLRTPTKASINSEWDVLNLETMRSASPLGKNIDRHFFVIDDLQYLLWRDLSQDYKEAIYEANKLGRTLIPGTLSLTPTSIAPAIDVKKESKESKADTAPSKKVLDNEFTTPIVDVTPTVNATPLAIETPLTPEVIIPEKPLSTTRARSFFHDINAHLREQDKIILQMAEKIDQLSSMVDLLTDSISAGKIDKGGPQG